MITDPNLLEEQTERLFEVRQNGGGFQQAGHSDLVRWVSSASRSSASSAGGLDRPGRRYLQPAPLRSLARRAGSGTIRQRISSYLALHTCGGKRANVAGAPLPPGKFTKEAVTFQLATAHFQSMFYLWDIQGGWASRPLASTAEPDAWFDQRPPSQSVEIPLGDGRILVPCFD